jgi:DNA-binding FadR family transcriptional regulator
LPNRPEKRPPVLRPVARPRNLTHEIAERIAAEISDGKLGPGARLPTEQEMVEAMGVSRTVVREAVAALRADGLVVTRQGAGAFVAPDATSRPFRLAVEELPSLKSVLDVMELRAGLEAETAALAAARATPAACKRLERALNAIDAAIRRGEDAVDEDFAFHCALAEATGNPQFAHFLRYLGRFIIPRQSVRVAAYRDEGQQTYLTTIQGEHRAIFTAVKAGDPARARAAMGRHLSSSQSRYRRLAADAKERA